MAKRRIERKPVTNLDALCEAYDYDKPSAFSRGMKVKHGNVVTLYISGTASVDEKGESVHIGDLEAQMDRMYHNVTLLLESDGADWHDVVRTTYYLRDIDRDYEEFNVCRCDFYRKVGLAYPPASTGVEARLCRPELLVEMEAIAMYVEE